MSERVQFRGSVRHDDDAFRRLSEDEAFNEYFRIGASYEDVLTLPPEDAFPVCAAVDRNLLILQNDLLIFRFLNIERTERHCALSICTFKCRLDLTPRRHNFAGEGGRRK